MTTSAPTSTLNGVYTLEQAARGRNIYLGQCRSCHNPSTGDAFEKLWAGKTVADLFTYIKESMPPNDPGALSRTDNADVVGFLLQATRMPAGTRDLPADRDSLKTIRIEVKKEAP
jgi:mono/diheme cytochrome c family protein